MFMKCVLCLGLFSNVALAAEHTQHAPVVSIDQEPSHHLVLKSASMRVFDVHFPAGKMSLWHSHDKDSVLFCLDGADVPSEEPGKEVVSRPPIPSGLIYYRPYGTTPFVHRIRNAGKTDFRILDIEVLVEREPGRVLPVLDKALSVVIENDRVRVSKGLLKPAQAFDPIRFSGPHLLVAATDGQFHLESPGKPFIEMTAKRGDLHMEEQPQQAAIRNVGTQDLEIVIVEVK
jgi:hypothetical protein